MRRRDFMKAAAGATASVWGLSSAPGAMRALGRAAGESQWKVLRIGAGGFIVGIDIAPDGTLVARTDTYGGYIWDTAIGAWRQLVKASTMPAPFVNVDHNAAAFELVVAPSASNILFMYYLGNILKSADAGKTWGKTGFAEVPGAEARDDYRTIGPAMAVDPRDPGHIVAGSPQSGLFRSTDGGETFNRIPSIPKETGPPGVQNVIFDPSSAALGGRTSVIYCAVARTGVYRSIDAGATWQRTDGGPSGHLYRVAIASNGVLFCTSEGSHVWTHSAGAWTDLGDPSGGAGVYSISVDPKNSARIVVGGPDGKLIQSLDGGSTWSSRFQFVVRKADDIPWLAWTKEDYMTNGEIRFHPTLPDKLIFAQGVGVWTTTLPQQADPRTHTIVWTSQSKGIEQLVANQILCPPGGNPVLAAWDRPVWYVSNPDAYPLRHGPGNRHAIVHGWALDYASSDPKYIAAVMGRQQWWAGGEPDIYSGYSRDGGQTWAPFAATPPWADGNGMGTIAAATPAVMVWVPTHSRQPYYTKDGGSTWSPVNLPGISAKDYSGLHWAFYLRRHNICADRVLPLTFYLCHTFHGLFRSSNGGDTWDHVYRGPIARTLHYNMKLRSTPGQPGHLWLTGGHQGGREDFASPAGAFLRSRDGGETWEALQGIVEAYDFGFGKPATAGGYPVIFIYGWVKGSLGLYRSDDEGASWEYLTTWPLDSLDMVACIEGDKNEFGKVYVGFAGSGFGYGST